MLDELIVSLWLIIHSKNREKNEIINIDIDKDKDIEGYVNIYNKIMDDKFMFVNRIVELYNNAIEKKEFKNLKDDVLKLISSSCICDVERKGCKKDNNKNDSGVKRKGRKKDNSKNVNINNDKDKDKDKGKDNLIDKLLNNKDKLHNFSDKVLNNLNSIAKLKEKILINKKKVREIRLKPDKYKKINILYDDLVNHIWRMIYDKNRVNNEIDNADYDIVEDAKRYATKYIKIVSDKQVLIYSVSESIDELIEGLDVNTSNDIAIKEIKDLKRVITESIDKFNSYIKLETKRKDVKNKDIEKKDIEKKDTVKKHIENVNTKKSSIKHDANNKPATSADIKAHIIDKQKLIKKKDMKVY